jgi:hypothetical protein
LISISEVRQLSDPPASARLFAARYLLSRVADGNVRLIVQLTQPLRRAPTSRGE